MNKNKFKVEKFCAKCFKAILADINKYNRMDCIQAITVGDDLQRTLNTKLDLALIHVNLDNYATVYHDAIKAYIEDYHEVMTIISNQHPEVEEFLSTLAVRMSITDVFEVAYKMIHATLKEKLDIDTKGYFIGELVWSVLTDTTIKGIPRSSYQRMIKFIKRNTNVGL